MEVNNVSSAAQSASGGAGLQLNQDFDQFLRLLTTQLKNQDPLEPLDASEFTNQLVQFSSVEQQIRTNKNLENLLSKQDLNLTALGVSFIGKSVEVQGSAFSADGVTGAELSYGLPQEAKSGTITILDDQGNTIYSQAADTSSGKHDFFWDGIDRNGNPVSAGNYTMNVSALTEDDISLNVTTYVPGYVSGLESSGDGNLLLRVGDERIPMEHVSKIYESVSR